MAKEVQLRRGTTAEIAAFTGLEGELAVDTTRSALSVHDGVTAGGFELVSSSSVSSRGYISGLTMSNDTDTDHDINVTPGVARNSVNTIELELLVEQTKQIDASFASGNDAGGLSSSLTVANNTWYHVFVFDIAGVTEVGFDISLTAANLVADHSAETFRRIGSILTDGSANIIQFFQHADSFVWKIPVIDYQETNPGTSEVTTQITTPEDVVTEAVLNVTMNVNADPATDVTFAVFSTFQTGISVGSNIGVNYNTSGRTDGGQNTAVFNILTSTTRQVLSKLTNSTASIEGVFGTLGWKDDRGRND